MSKKKKSKLYVVGRGRRPGIFATWDEAKAQVDGYPGAKYKSFTSLIEAKKAYAEWMGLEEASVNWEQVLPAGAAAQFATKSRLIGDPGPKTQAICVDAASSGNPGPVEYRGVDLTTGREIFHRGPLADGTNNVGEFLALVHGLQYLQEKELDWPIYSDSRIALGWVGRHKKARTNVKPTGRNGRLFVLIEQAEKWLAENKYANQLLKWDTENWGEIPADFGRK
ncbi:MAG: ribonuclease H family protein [Ardenticatenaceae bacterium]|nr:ribonuclease H family protein [Ardenticatenaceae bacterium]